MIELILVTLPDGVEEGGQIFIHGLVESVTWVSFIPVEPYGLTIGIQIFGC